MKGQAKKVAISAFIGAVLGMLAFYYVRYMTPPADDEAPVLRAVRYIPTGTKLERNMVEVEHVPKEFISANILHEGDLNDFLGKKVIIDVEAESILSRSHFSR